ncbi:hypothetical protein O181_007243 [Austropuccinia psidii MF-1]|uniref:Uncharacterized protein n=1 Tax=Austropuccinia psidii MF-1 TaxID=1389203 RepID=A0A9Q3GHD4_9BASI|nr:hypothetical protein [Austropuccinia psidii MF-1]
MKEDLIEYLFQYRKALLSDNEPIESIKGNEVDIMFNVGRSYSTPLRRPAYPAIPTPKEGLESHINELLKLGVIRKFGQNEEVELTTPLIITWKHDKSRMVGHFGALNTYNPYNFDSTIKRKIDNFYVCTQIFTMEVFDT